MTISPYTIWYLLEGWKHKDENDILFGDDNEKFLKNGWKYKDVKTSDPYVGIYRFIGASIIILTIFIIIFV